jgi:hypothetical protein
MASAGAVNPLYRGLSPLTDTPITTAIQTLEKRDANAAWIGYENIYLGNLLASNGVRVLNGTYYHPNLEFWKRFDPSLRYLGIYNRYEHLLVHAADERQVRFKLIQADVVQLGISPCNPTLEEVGVEFHVFDSPQSQYSCLKLVERIPYPMVTFYVYQRADLE